jgi:hypothetical protein
VVKCSFCWSENCFCQDRDRESLWRLLTKSATSWRRLQLQNLNRGTERERLVFAMRDTRWDETRWTKVFVRIASVSNILLGFFYLGGTKVQKGGSLFPSPFRDSLTHPANPRCDLTAGRPWPNELSPDHFTHLISSHLSLRTRSGMLLHCGSKWQHRAATGLQKACSHVVLPTVFPDNQAF